MNYRYFLQQLLLIFVILIPVCSYAQTGRQWGTTNITATSGIAEASIVNLDSAGNVYSAQAEVGQAYFVFGSDTVHDPGLFTIAIISKTDNAGHKLWAVGTDSTNAIILSMATDKQGNSYAFGEYDSSRSILGSMRALNPLHN